MPRGKRTASQETTPRTESSVSKKPHDLFGRHVHIPNSGDNYDGDGAENLIISIYMQAIQDYGICLRAKAKGKTRLNNIGWVDQCLDELDAFFLENLGDVWGKKLIEKIKSEAPKENRGSGWPRKPPKGKEGD